MCTHTLRPVSLDREHPSCRKKHPALPGSKPVHFRAAPRQENQQSNPSSKIPSKRDPAKVAEKSCGDRSRWRTGTRQGGTVRFRTRSLGLIRSRGTRLSETARFRTRLGARRGIEGGGRGLGGKPRIRRTCGRLCLRTTLMRCWQGEGGGFRGLGLGVKGSGLMV